VLHLQVDEDFCFMRFELGRSDGVVLGYRPDL
jgi:hypothetical protein